MSRDLSTLVFVDDHGPDATVRRAAHALRCGDLARAEEFAMRAAKDTRFGVRALRVLAVTRIKGGRSEGALTILLDARARLSRELVDVDARALAADLDHRIAHLAHTLDRTALALSAYEACLAGAPSARLVARARHDLGVLLVEEERFEDALRVLHRALAERERVFGLGSREVARTLRELAVIAAEQGALDRARALYERALFALGHDERALRQRYFSELSRLSRAARSTSVRRPRVLT